MIFESDGKKNIIGIKVGYSMLCTHLYDGKRKKIFKVFKEKDVSRNLTSRQSCHGFERAGAAKYSSPVGFSLIVRLIHVMSDSNQKLTFL